MVTFQLYLYGTRWQWLLNQCRNAYDMQRHHPSSQPRGETVQYREVQKAKRDRSSLHSSSPLFRLQVRTSKPCTYTNIFCPTIKVEQGKGMRLDLNSQTTGGSMYKDPTLAPWEKRSPLKVDHMLEWILAIAVIHLLPHCFHHTLAHGEVQQASVSSHVHFITMVECYPQIQYSRHN